MRRDYHDSKCNDQDGSPVWLRAAFVAAALGVWFLTQSWIGKRASPPGAMVDSVHVWLSPLHGMFTHHPGAADALLVTSSAGIDAAGIFLLGLAIFGSTLRPFIALILVFGLRQICQGLCALPPPEGMIWRDPGFPTLLVTYGVSNDLFFSGHTSLAVLGALELARLGKRWLVWAGVLLALFEITTVLVLHAHYTMDVFAGAIAALWIHGIAVKVSPALDGALARFGRQG